MNEFINFLSSKDEVPSELSRRVQRDIQLSFRKKQILSKFILFYALGALVSLSFCPQFGMGLMSGHGISHYFRIIGDWACAAFCGALFLSAGLLSVGLNMKLEEVNWVWSRYKYSLIFLPVLSWMTLMLLNVTFQTGEETLSFHMNWIIFALIAQMSIMFVVRKVEDRSIRVNL